MTGHRPFSELSDGLRRRLADRDAERRRIWAAIVAWTEIAHRLDDDGQPVAVEGTEFQPLSPYFSELHAMVFPDEDAGALIAEPSAPAESAVIPDEQGSAPAGDTRAFNPVAEQTGSPASAPTPREES